MIYFSCCQSDRQTFTLPIKCFEDNECFGLHWLPEDVCSEKFRSSIETKIKNVKKELITNSAKSEKSSEENYDYYYGEDEGKGPR